jgi:ABC-type amino acid transport substrate-binding protein
VTKTSMKRATGAAAALVLALTGAACGGGESAEPGDTPAPTSTEATDSAADDGSGEGTETPAEAGEVPGLVTPGTLTLVSTGNFPPCTFIDDSGKVQGYSIDIGQEAADRLGLEFASPTVDFVAELQGVQSGQYDLGDGCVNVTDERRETFEYTRPLGSTTFVALIREEDSGEIAGLEDLTGLRAGVVEGASRQAWAMENEAELNYDSLTGFPGFSELVLGLQNDRIDVIIDDFVASTYYIEQNPDAGLAIAGEGVEPTIFAMVMRKDNTEFHSAINAVFDEMVEDGTLGQMQEKWFGQPLGTPSDLDAEPPFEPAPTS